MAEHVIPDDDGKGLTMAFIGDEIEYSDPVKYYSERQIQKTISLEKQLLHLADPIKAALLPEDFFVKRASEKWDAQYNKIIKVAVPPNFIKLLSSKSKKKQIQLLRGQGLTPNQLAAFLFKAHSEFGYTFSSYTAEHYHKSLDESALPNFISVKDGKVKSSGKTSLTEGQLKQVVEQRKVTVSKFLDKDNAWHCFFLTFRSLRGEEFWKDGQPHFHYISDKWDIPRDDAVKQLKSEKYPSTAVHIDLLDYN